MFDNHIFKTKAADTKPCEKCNGMMQEYLNKHVMLGKPNAGLNISKRFLLPKAFVCSECGFVEFYLKN